MLLALIHKPFPINTWNWYKYRGIGFGLFVFLFLVLFKPFYLHLYINGLLLYHAAIYGFITAGVIFLGGLTFVKLVVPKMAEEKWTLGKQIILNVILMLVITFFNILITQLLHNTILPVSWYFYMFQWVLMIGLLPIIIAELISYNFYLRNHLQSASEINRIALLPYRAVKPALITNESLVAKEAFLANEIRIIDKSPETIYRAPRLIITGENQADKLSLTQEQLLAVQALDNYVNIFWDNENTLQTTLLRNTLTNISEQLKDQVSIYRSHRGWLVNSNRVNQVEGNAQGLKLTLDLMEQPVPVSRGNIAGYRQLMQEQHTVIHN